MRPSLVERITNEKNEVVESFQPEQVRRVISEETAKKVVSLLKGATERGGTGEGAVPAGYEVAGKTGTAQKLEPLFKEYSEDRTNAGFIGFVPPEDPKIVLLVIIDEPQGSTTGGVVAAPVFKAIMEKVLPYLNVHPKGTLMVKNTSNLYSDRGASLEEQAIEEVRVGKGVEKLVMPDLTGLPMRKALSRIEGKGLIIKFSGNGRVVEQTPRPGTVIEKGDICYLKFQSRL
jgi:cell division protein FtsI (penicillin-binding protein 3)